MTPNDILKSLLLRKVTVEINQELIDYLDMIIKERENRIAVMTMTICLLLKKHTDPSQNITLHQAKMTGGFSARGFDERFVTPFLKDNKFPYMKSGSGALTRSLEHSIPFNLGYTGGITPKELKKAFLEIVDSVQNRGAISEELLIYILNKLVIYRDRDTSIKLIIPSNLSIKDMVAKLHQHFNACKHGARLPQLAIYAVYTILTKEMDRYKQHTLCKLQSHQSADRKTHFLGDIQVNDENGIPFEVVEIKHKIQLTANLVEECYDKFKTSKINTFYLLSTNEELKEPEEISNKIMYIYKTHGCQMIVNGVFITLKYYLRLLSDPYLFLNKYLELVEQDSKYEVKVNWQNMWDSVNE